MWNTFLCVGWLCKLFSTTCHARGPGRAQGWKKKRPRAHIAAKSTLPMWSLHLAGSPPRNSPRVDARRHVGKHVGRRRWKHAWRRVWQHVWQHVWKHVWQCVWKHVWKMTRRNTSKNHEKRVVHGVCPRCMFRYHANFMHAVFKFHTHFTHLFSHNFWGRSRKFHAPVFTPLLGPLRANFAHWDPSDWQKYH